MSQTPPLFRLAVGTWFLAVGMGWGTLLLLPAVAWELASGQTMVFDTISLASVAYVCLFPSLLGYLCLNRGIDLIGANRAAPLFTSSPCSDR